MRIAPATEKGSDRFAIRPYPNHLEERVEVAGRKVLVRPIRPEDEADFKAFISKSAGTNPYFRFFHLARELPHSQLARFTQIDYDREMALVALCQGEMVGEVRAVTEPDNLRAEFSFREHPDWSKTGLDRMLISRLITYCRERGTQQLVGDISPGDQRLLDVVSALGFRNLHDAGKTVRIVLELGEAVVA